MTAELKNAIAAIDAVANGSAFEGDRVQTVTLTVKELVDRDLDNFWSGYALAINEGAEALREVWTKYQAVTLDTQTR
jgi:hypothetical protein